MVLGTVSDAVGPSSRVGSKWGNLRVAFAVLGGNISESKRKDRRNHLERLARNPVIQTKLRELWSNLTFSKEDGRIDFSGYKAMCKVLASVVGVECKDVSATFLQGSPSSPPPSHLSHLEIRQEWVEEDWKDDSDNTDFLDEERYQAAVLELCVLHAEQRNVKCYLELLGSFVKASAK